MTDPEPVPPAPAPDRAPAAAPAVPAAATTGPAPAGAEKLLERPHPLTPLIRGWVVLLAVAFGFGRDMLHHLDGTATRPALPLELLVGGVGLAALAAVAVGFVSWRFTRFVIDTAELRVDTGWLFRQSTRIAFGKVQAIDVVQPLAARIFGLAELQIDVGSDNRVRLRYLKLARAYALRDYLLSRARGHTDSVVAAEVRPDSVLVDLHASDEVLVRIPPQTLVLAAITSHEFFGIVAGGLITGALALVAGLNWGLLAIAVPTVTGLIGFVGRRLTGQFNYTLSRREHGLRISRGLTNLTSQSLPPRRVQAVQLSQSPLWRRLGLYRIDVAVLGWGGQTDSESSSDVSTIMLPAGTIEQVRVALAAIWPRADFEAIALERPPRRASWVHPFARPFLRWGHDDQLSLTRHGWLVRTWQLVPHARTQSVRITQGPLERRLRVAQLHFHVAGGGFRARAYGVDATSVAERQAELLHCVHTLPELDISEATPAALQPDEDAGAAVPAGPVQEGPVQAGPVQAGPVQAGPDAFLADQAEATISSTE